MKKYQVVKRMFICTESVVASNLDLEEANRLCDWYNADEEGLDSYTQYFVIEEKA